MKRFIIKILILFLPLWLFLVGLTLYITFIISPKISGDLGRLGCIPFGVEYDRMISDSTINTILYHTEDNPVCLNAVQTDILTIGDSYSDCGVQGYQNYLCEKGYNVVNFFNSALNENPLQLSYDLLNSNYIDSTTTKLLVVETAERLLVRRINSFYKKGPVVYTGDVNKQNKVQDPNSWSLMRSRDYVLYKLRLSTPVQNLELKSSFFSGDKEWSNQLFFYDKDVSSTLQMSKDDQKKFLFFYNEILKLCKEKGVDLIILVAPDKYDMYQDYVINNRFPRKTINEDLLDLNLDSNILILLKYYLKPLIDNGTKDVYLLNDSHWSYKSARVVAEEVTKRALNN